jgi:hypothetical protein
MDYPAEGIPFRVKIDGLWRVRTFRGLSCGNFRMAKSLQSQIFKGRSLLLKLIPDNKAIQPWMIITALYL